MDGFSARELSALFNDVPTTTLRYEEVVGRPAVELAVQCGACNSNADAKRLIKSGGLYVNNQRVESAEEDVRPDAWIEGEACVVRSGKKKYFLVLRNGARS